MEGDQSLLLFLKRSGTTWCYVPGASKGSVRFGGALEPLVWGRFQLYQSKRRNYLREVEVTDDFWELRKNPKGVFVALRWAKLLQNYLIDGYPYDPLLALLYWGMKALQRGVEPELVNARLLWRWLLDWGIAPDFYTCSLCGQPLNGEGAWLEGGFCCRSCSKGLKIERFDAFANYALAKSFNINAASVATIEQARELQKYFVKNLEDNR